MSIMECAKERNIEYFKSSSDVADFVHKCTGDAGIKLYIFHLFLN